MLCSSSVFYRIWFLLSLCLINSAPSYNPFFRVIQASHLEAEAKCCPRPNQGRAVQAAWERCRPSTPRRDSKTGELARNSGRRAKLFLLSHWHREENRACLPGRLCNSSREGAAQAARWATTRSCSRRPNLAPDSNASLSWSTRESGVEPTTIFRYSSFRDRERSLDSGRLRKASRHLRANGVSPLSLRRP